VGTALRQRLEELRRAGRATTIVKREPTAALQLPRLKSAAPSETEDASQTLRRQLALAESQVGPLVPHAEGRPELKVDLCTQVKELHAKLEATLQKLDQEVRRTAAHERGSV
jgi:hypothetical protein